MLKGFSMRFVRDRRMIRFGRRWNTTHVASEVPAAHHHADENGMTALHWEAKKDCPDVVKSLVDAGADIEARDSLGSSPLLVACENGNIAKVKMLVEAGASVRDTGNKKETCLTLAAENGHTETVRYLVGLPEVDVEHEVENVTALNRAVTEGHSDVVQVLIDAGARIEAKYRLGWTPMLAACYKGNLIIVKMLVEAGASVHSTDYTKETCLTLAAGYGHTETVRYLVGLPEVEVNEKARNKHTALHSAVSRGHPDVVQLLIDAGADIEARNNFGHSPLLVASSKGKLSIVKLLVKAGAELCATDYRDTCLTLAAGYGHTETVRYLAGLQDLDVNHAEHGDFTALHNAVYGVHWHYSGVPEGYPDVVQVLIDAGADIEAKDDMGRSPLLHACCKGNLGIVKMLVEGGASVRATDNESETCLTLAAHHGHTETVRYLAGLPEVDINHKVMNKHTALHRALLTRHSGVVQVLIDAGADIEATNHMGRSPLLVATEGVNAVYLKMLVEAGASVRATDNKRESCLTLAAHHGNNENVRYLVSLKDVDVNHTAHENNTALHNAVHRGETYAVHYLIDAGVDIEAKDRMGRSPLHLACKKGDLQVVEMLVEKAGAEVHAADNEGNTCLTIAEKNGHTKTVRYLKNLPQVDVKQTDRLGNTALRQRRSESTAGNDEECYGPAEGDVGGTEGGGTTQR